MSYLRTQYCIVPTCKNTERNNPTKIFISVPFDRIKRNLWLCAVGRTSIYSNKSNISVCEDHFNLQEDMANYLEYKMMGTKKRMKPDVVPHLAVGSAKKTKLSSDADAAQPSISNYDEIDIKEEFKAALLTSQDIHIKEEPQMQIKLDIKQELDIPNETKEHIFNNKLLIKHDIDIDIKNENEETEEIHIKEEFDVFEDNKDLDYRQPFEFIQCGNASDCRQDI